MMRSKADIIKDMDENNIRIDELESLRRTIEEDIRNYQHNNRTMLRDLEAAQ